MKSRFARFGALVLALLMLASLLASCGSKEEEETAAEEATTTVVFPANYYDYFDYSPSEDVDSLKELGTDYYTKVSKKGNTLVITATEAQIRKLIARNNYYCSEAQNAFLGAGDGYSITGADDYTEVEFVLNEKMDEETRDTCILTILNAYAMNQFLKGAGEDDWSIKVTFYNSDTGDKITSAKIPDEDLVLSTDDLAA